MRTKIVYTLCSSDNDCYLESLWASLHSLRIHNPDSHVVVLTDARTAERIRQREGLLRLITELKAVSMPDGYTPKEMSRELKTTVRKHVEGAFLYIDNDTVITAALDGVDSLDCDIALVPECHVPLEKFAFRSVTYNNVLRIFGEDAHDSKYFFNSGVMYVADNETTHGFYRRWNENWRYSTFEKRFSQDQPALLKTDKEFGYIIKPLPGEYNCQITMSVQYLHTAKIIHFVHWGVAWDASISPFMGDALYSRIKADGGISAASHEAIQNVKDTFLSPTMMIGEKPMLFFFSTTGQVFYKLHRDSRRWERFLDWIAGRINLYYRAKRKIGKKFNRNGK